MSKRTIAHRCGGDWVILGRFAEALACRPPRLPDGDRSNVFHLERFQRISKVFRGLKQINTLPESEDGRYTVVKLRQSDIQSNHIKLRIDD